MSTGRRKGHIGHKRKSHVTVSGIENEAHDVQHVTEKETHDHDVHVSSLKL